MAKLKVYYNSACPVCNAGIAGQKRRMEGCEVQWIDIHADENAVCEINAEREFVRERLHVVDENGQTKIGAEALEALWSHTKGQRLMARFTRLPGVNAISRWLYNGFAAGLYAWNRRNGRW